MNRSVRRLLQRLILLASPLGLLSLAVFCLVSSNENLLQPQDNGDSDVQPQLPCAQPHEDVQRQLQQLKQVIAQLEDQLRRQGETSFAVGISDKGGSPKNGPCSSSYIQKQVEQSEMERGKRWHNEYEIVPHALFTLGAFYPTEPGLGRRVVERPIGSRRQDLQEAVSSALSILNSQQPTGGRRLMAQDFIEGLYRIDPIEGTQYELWFRRPKTNTDDARPDLVKVALIRPHAPLTAVSVGRSAPHAERQQSILNIIVPLAGRLLAFQSFLDRFEQQILLADGAERIHLTVVFFGNLEWGDVQRLMLNFEKRTRFSNFHLLNTNGTFSRARGLQIGVQHWENPADEDDTLIFLCDVDVDFDAQFIGRCRRNTIPNRQAYFPIVFSLYNPNVTRQLHHRDGSQKLHKDTGFWRDFGFGMLCTYRSDFISLGGFQGGDASSGWGGEDLFLYRKYIRSTLRVIRSPDPNLFHLWHPKSCPSSLGPVQQRACLQSRARNEASHDQLGLLLFSTDL